MEPDRTAIFFKDKDFLIFSRAIDMIRNESCVRMWSKECAETAKKPSVSMQEDIS